MGNDGRNSPLTMEIVGLMRDAKYSQVKDTIPPLFFAPYRQTSGSARSTSTCGRPAIRNPSW